MKEGRRRWVGKKSDYCAITSSYYNIHIVVSTLIRLVHAQADPCSHGPAPPQGQETYSWANSDPACPRIASPFHSLGQVWEASNAGILLPGSSQSLQAVMVKTLVFGLPLLSCSVHDLQVARGYTHPDLLKQTLYLPNHPPFPLCSREIPQIYYLHCYILNVTRPSTRFRIEVFLCHSQFTARLLFSVYSDSNLLLAALLGTMLYRYPWFVVVDQLEGFVLSIDRFDYRARGSGAVTFNGSACESGTVWPDLNT